MNRKIYISASLLEECIRDKHSLDALAFCVMVKRMFVSSTVKDATYRRMKSLFGIGTDKLQRIIHDATRMQLISYSDDHTLSVAPLKQLRGLNYVFAFTVDTKKGVSNLHTDMPVARVVRYLRGEYLRNHLLQQKRNVDAYKGCSNPSSMKELKRNKKYCMSHIITVAAETMSNQRISTLLNVGVRTVRNVIHPLEWNGQVKRVPTYIPTRIHLHEYSRALSAYLSEKLLIPGYLFASRRNGCVYMRMADRFEVNDTTPLHYISQRKR